MHILTSIEQTLGKPLCCPAATRWTGHASPYGVRPVADGAPPPCQRRPAPGVGPPADRVPAFAEQLPGCCLPVMTMGSATVSN